MTGEMQFKGDMKFLLFDGHRDGLQGRGILNLHAC